MEKHPLQYDLEVMEDGKVMFDVPFPRGAHVTVFVVGGRAERLSDNMQEAAQSSLDFWDNPFDDEDWNNV